MSKPNVYILTYGFVKKAPEDSSVGKTAFHIGVTVGLIEYFKNQERKFMIVDPGMAADWPKIKNQTEKLGIKKEQVSHVLVTHWHQDHIQNLKEFMGAICFSAGQSSIIGQYDYGAKDLYQNGTIEMPEIKYENFEFAHTRNDTVYFIDSENEGKVAFIGDLVFSLFDQIPIEAQIKLDKNTSINSNNRFFGINNFYQDHPEIKKYYLGHYYRAITRKELGEYLEKWPR